MCWNVSLCEQQEKVQIRKELWRIEDVIAGLSTSKANYKVTISSVTNPGKVPYFKANYWVKRQLLRTWVFFPHRKGFTVFTASTVCIFVPCSFQSPERKFVPSVSVSSVPSVSGNQSATEMRLSQQQHHTSHVSPGSHIPTLSSSPTQQPLQHSATVFSGFTWVSDPFYYFIKPSSMSVCEQICLVTKEVYLTTLTTLTVALGLNKLSFLLVCVRPVTITNFARQ